MISLIRFKGVLEELFKREIDIASEADLITHGSMSLQTFVLHIHSS